MNPELLAIVASRGALEATPLFHFDRSQPAVKIDISFFTELASCLLHHASTTPSTAPRNLMRFALIGDHVDGLEMARALAQTGRHELALYSGPALGSEILSRWNLTPPRQADLEEVLADPAV